MKTALFMKNNNKNLITEYWFNAQFFMIYTKLAIVAIKQMWQILQ